MKLPVSIRISLCSIRVLSLLFMVLIGAGVAPAQNTNAPNPSADLPDALRFPTNTSLLPGKGPISGWKPFPQLWARRRADFWRHRQEDKGKVVFLGDSITQGWNSLAQDFPDLKIANRGIGGDTTRGVWFRLREDVLDEEPAAVVLLIGTNDLGSKGNPKDAAKNISAILAALKETYPQMPVIVCKVMPSKKSVAANIKKLNARLEKIVKADPHLILCDTWSIYANEDGTCKREEFPDMLHPNKAGYAKWTAALRPIFAKLDLPARKAE